MKQTVKLAVSCVFALSLLTGAYAQRRGDGGPAAPPDRNSRMVVVTAVPRHEGGGEPIQQRAVTVQQNGKDDQIRDWQAVDAQTTVDLAIIIDEDTQNITVQLNDVRTFIKELPPNVRVGLGYMSAGAILFAQSAFTPDRNLILSKLRLPSGDANASPSPYTSVQYLMQRWHARPGQVHEMLMISDGIEHVGGNSTNNITLKQAVADTVQAGVVVFAIAATGTGSTSGGDGGGNGGSPIGGAGTGPLGAPSVGPGNGAGPAIVNGLAGESGSIGIMNLGELTEATGGLTYAGSEGTPPRFTEYLDDVLLRLKNQYMLGFESAKAKSGLNPIKIEVRAPNEKVTVPRQIFVGK